MGNRSLVPIFSRRAFRTEEEAAQHLMTQMQFGFPEFKQKISVPQEEPPYSQHYAIDVRDRKYPVLTGYDIGVRGHVAWVFLPRDEVDFNRSTSGSAPAHVKPEIIIGRTLKP
jgi:hypothetical protein